MLPAPALHKNYIFPPHLTAISHLVRSVSRGGGATVYALLARFQAVERRGHTIARDQDTKDKGPKFNLEVRRGEGGVKRCQHRGSVKRARGRERIGHERCRERSRCRGVERRGEGNRFRSNRSVERGQEVERSPEVNKKRGQQVNMWRGWNRPRRGWVRGRGQGVKRARGRQVNNTEQARGRDTPQKVKRRREGKRPRGHEEANRGE